MTVDEFLAAYEGREGDWEIENGVVYANGARSALATRASKSRRYSRSATPSAALD